MNRIAGQLTLYRPVDNPGMIGITQPRRVAAMSMASHVAHKRMNFHYRHPKSLTGFATMVPYHLRLQLSS